MQLKLEKEKTWKLPGRFRKGTHAASGGQTRQFSKQPGRALLICGIGGALIGRVPDSSVRHGRWSKCRAV